MKWCCCLCVTFTMKVIEQNRLRVRPSQVYFGVIIHCSGMEPTYWGLLPTGHHWTGGQPNLQSQDTGNHAEAATWSGHTGPWTCTGGITPSTVLPQSTHLLIPPFEEKVGILYTWNIQSCGGQGQRLSWRQRGRPQPRVPQGLWH